MRNKIYAILSLAITIGFILLGVFVFNLSYLRLWESIKDLGLSVGFFFCEIFGIEHTIIPTVTNSSRVMVWDILLPEDFATFKSNVVIYFNLLFNGENFVNWFNSISMLLLNIVVAIIIAIPTLKLLKLILSKIYGRVNQKHNIDTLPLRIFKGFIKVTYRPVKRFVLGYINFLRQYERIWKLWVLIWALHINLGSIIVGFFAYLFYFISTFDLTTIYPQIVKLAVDLQVILRYFPWWIIAFVVWLIFLNYRKKIAINKLRRFEARNCGFIKELPIVSIACGAMGTKKTTFITDMALSQEVMFRQKAFEILQKNDIKFPFFPWICFENQLQHCIEFGTVYNLATVKEFVKKKRERFGRGANLYDYDYKRYGLSYDNGLFVEDLFDVMTTYGQAYFIYILYTSLIVSNYSIMTDNQMMSYGNFPMWAMEFFPDEYREEKRHVHILDFDVLRLGKKIIEKNPNIGSFEFGVVAITEIGKERGNNLELQEIKKKDDSTNQKNDLFNAWLKMSRHSATVDNFPFIKVFTDEQRPESWGADARDLCEIIRIINSGKSQLALPFYTIEEMISEIAFDSFISLYYDLRFKRGDNTLLVYVLKHIVEYLFKRNVRIWNRYGYSKLFLEKERGIMDGKVDKKVYFIMNGKIYRKRFSTDCFSDYFNELARKTKVGLNDYKEYLTEKASVEELKLQNSYFINSLYK